MLFFFLKKKEEEETKNFQIKSWIISTLTYILYYLLYVIKVL